MKVHSIHEHLGTIRNNKAFMDSDHSLFAQAFPNIHDSCRVGTGRLSEAH